MKSIVAVCLVALVVSCEGSALYGPGLGYGLTGYGYLAGPLHGHAYSHSNLIKHDVPIVKVVPIIKTVPILKHVPVYSGGLGWGGYGIGHSLGVSGSLGYDGYGKGWGIGGSLGYGL